MSPARWDGPGRRSSRAQHAAGAPHPTCSCLDCRRARDAEVGDGWKGAVRRMRDGIARRLERPAPAPDVRPIREHIYGELRELERERPDRDVQLPWDDHR